MAKQIEIDVVVNGKMQKATVSAKKLKSALDGVDKGQDKVSKSNSTMRRNMQGAAAATSNSTKEFAKMSQGMGGLVAVYAQIAAATFAVSAAFQFMKDAMEVRNLMEGQKAFGAVTGVAYASMTRNIREATDGMLGFRDAAQAAAIGTAAGLSRGQLEQLGAAAKNVSFALGRDLTDSFNRLVRGVTKAEPELLDELGIVLRLDPALKAYAVSVGKSVKDLNQFEKSQAIANDVLGQAESKFAAIAKIMDPNAAALAQFQSEFSDLANTVKVAIAENMIPVFNFLKENTASLVGALSLIALPILRQILPNFEQMGLSAEKNFKKAKKAADRAQINSAQFSAASRLAGGSAAARADVMSTSAARGKKLGIDVKGQAEQQGMLSKRQLAIYRKHLNDKELLRKKYSKKERMEFRRFMAEQEALLAQSQSKQVAIVKRGHMQMRATFAATAAAYRKSQQAMVVATGYAAKGMNKLMKGLGWAGIALMAYEIGKQIYDWAFPITDAEQALKDYEDRIKNLTGAQKELTDEIRRMNEVRENKDINLSVLEEIKQEGQALQSMDLSKTLEQYRLEAKKSNEVSKLLAEEMANTVAETAKLTGDEGLAELARIMRIQGDITEDLEDKLEAYTNKTIAASTAVARHADLIKAANAAIAAAAAPALKYAGAIAAIDAALDNQASFAPQEIEKIQGLSRQIRDLQKQIDNPEPIKLFDTEGNLRSIQEMEAMQAQALKNRKDFLDQMGVTYTTEGKGANTQFKFTGAFAGQEDTLLKYQPKMPRFAEAMEGGEPVVRTAANEEIPMAGPDGRVIVDPNSYEKQNARRRGDAAAAQDEQRAQMENLLSLYDEATTAAGNRTAEEEYLLRVMQNMIDLQDQAVQHKKDQLKLQIKEGNLATRLDLTSEQRQIKGLKLAEDRLNLQNEDKKAQIEIAEAAIGRLKDENEQSHTINSLRSMKVHLMTQEEKAALEAYNLAVAEQAVTQAEIANQKVLNALKRQELQAMERQKDAARELAKQERARALARKKDEVDSINARSPAERAAIALREVDRLENRRRDRLTQLRSLQTDIFIAEIGTWQTVEENGMQIKKRVVDTERLRQLQEQEAVIIQDRALMEEDINRIIASRQALIDANVSRTEELLALGNIAKNTTFAGSSAQGGTPGNAAATFGADVKSGLFGASDAGQEYIKAVTALENAGLMNVDAKGNKLTDAQVEERKKEMFKQAHEVSVMNIELKKTEAISGAISSAFDGLFDAILDGTSNFGDAMKGVMHQLLKDMAKAYMQAAAMKALNMATMAMGIPGIAARGGVFGASGGMMPGYAVGGIASGPKSGYPVTLHGTEAVVPLPDGRSIPVAMEGGGQNNNVSVTVNMSGMGQSQQSANGGGAGGVDGQELGRSIAGLVQQHLQDQMRPGGLLNRQGQTGRI